MSIGQFAAEGKRMYRKRYQKQIGKLDTEAELRKRRWSLATTRCEPLTPPVVFNSLIEGFVKVSSDTIIG